MTVIIAAFRTPIGKFGGQFSNVPASELGATVIRALLDATGIAPAQIDEVILGNVLQAGQGQGPARQAAIKAGLPVSVPASTLNMICGSGLKAVQLGAALIDSGQAEIVIAGGMENMSAAPYLLPDSRWGQRMGHGNLIDSMLNDALTDAFEGCHMGITAERLADQYSISRADQDAFAFRSQSRTEKAVAENVFDDEIVPVAVTSGREEILIDRDESPRKGITSEKLSALPAIFADPGTVTAGNASGINDGAAALLLMADDKARELGIIPMASILSSASTGVDPGTMGIGPVSAIEKVLKNTGLDLSQIGLIELNEAFAAQALSVCQALDIDQDKVNIHGGAIALGHPVGASGARILVTLLHAMQRQQIDYGLASLCVGGGMGVATLVQNYQS